MIGESNNPGHEVYIDGFKLEGNFIPYNTGVDIDNTINSLRGELTTGKDYVKYLNEKSRSLSFKTILTDQMAEDGYQKILESVVKKAKKEPVKIIFDETSFMGMVLEFSISFPVENYREYTWLIVETEPFKPATKNFNTYNYKKASTATKTALKFTPSLEVLLKCNPVKNCGKTGISCVISWQRYLQSQGYLMGKNDKDGEFCKNTESETKRWQKAHGIKATGKVDAATKAFLARNNVASEESLIDPVTAGTKALAALARLGR